MQHRTPESKTVFQRPFRRRLVLACGLAAALASCSKKSADKAPGETAKTQGAKEQKEEAAPSPVVPAKLPGNFAPAPWLEGATKVAALGSGKGAIIVAAGNGWLRWFDVAGTKLGERVGEGAAQLLRTEDVDGDGRLEVLYARGLGRGAKDAPVRLEIVRISADSSEAETIPLPETTRSQVSGAAAAGDGSIWVASFVGKYQVEVGRYEKSSDGWAKVEDRGQHRVVSSLEVFDGEPVIARMYGENADQPGGVYALHKGKAPLAIPSTRGARALAVLPQRTGLVMADGWHKNYARKAKGLVTFATRKSWGWTKRTSTEVAKNFGFAQLRIGNPHSAEGPEVVASGNGPAVVILPSKPDVAFALGDAVAADAVPVQIEGDDRDEVVIAGPTPGIWSAR